MSKYPSAIEIPPSIKRIDSIPQRRSYEEIISGLLPTQIEYMRQKARAEFERATDCYKQQFSIEDGIRYLVVSADWTRNLCQRQDRK